MSVETWGLLDKSQTDDEKIEEAIARLIAEHNADETAHLGSGQSLQSHKAAEIIDHLIASIVADKIKDGELSLPKLNYDTIQIFSAFESLDGWTKSLSGIQTAIGGVEISTGTTINTVRNLIAESFGDASALDWDKNTFFQTCVKLSAITNQLVYFGAGSTELDGTDNFFGFKVLNGTLYAIHIKSDGENQTEYTTEITGITLTNFNGYRAMLDVSTGTIKFYVNGVLKATHDSNIPTIDSPVIFSYYLKNTAAENKYLYAKYFSFSKSQ